MSDSLKGIKKFKFFEIDKTEKDKNAFENSLSDITPIAFRVCDNFYYVAGQLKEDKKTKDTKLFKIFQLHPSGKIIEAFAPFTDCIIDFDIVKSEDRLNFIIIGTDLRSEGDKSKAKVVIIEDKKEKYQEKKIQITPSPNSIPSIKFYNPKITQNEIEEKNEIEEENKENTKEEDKFNLYNIIYLMHKKNNINDFYKEENLSSLTEAYIPVPNISFFSISPLMNAVALCFQDLLV